MRLFDKRTVQGKPVRRFAEDKTDLVAGDGRKLSGYAMLWDVLSDPFPDGWRVRLARNAAMFEPTIFALWHHDYRLPIAGTNNGTLIITPDDRGVRVEMTTADTTAGRDAFENVRTKLAQGMSFDCWDSVSDFDQVSKVETIKSCRVTEVTVTPLPRFTQTTIGVTGPAAEFSRGRSRSRSELNRLLLHELKAE